MSGQKKGKEAVLFPGERLDDLQLNGLELIQDPKKFCFGAGRCSDRSRKYIWICRRNVLRRCQRIEL